MPVTRNRLTPRLALSVLPCLWLAACEPAARTEAANPPTVAVATLDGEPLSRALLDELARQQAGTINPYDAPTASAPSAASGAPVASRQQLLDDLIDIEILARKARERGLDKQPAMQAEDELQTKTILAQAMVREQIAGLTVSDAELAAAYEERVPPHMFKLAHILFTEQAPAQAALSQLQQGQPFAEWARRHPSEDLGLLMADQMPPEFAAAVRHLKPGEYATQPVHTAQGWHVVQLQGLEPLPARPTLQTARAWLHPQIIHAKVQAQQQQWRAEATVQRSDTP